jgi:hypothetical protein
MNVDGKSVVLSDDKMQAYEFKSVPGYEHTLVWVDPTTPNLRNGQGFVRYPASVVPGPGGTSLHFVTFPPSSVLTDPSFDGEAARREALVRLRGLADHFEEEDPAMHKTNTVDYAVVYDGEIWLERQDCSSQEGRCRRPEWYSARMAKQKHRAGDDVVLSKRCKGVTATRWGEVGGETRWKPHGPVLEFTTKMQVQEPKHSLERK